MHKNLLLTGALLALGLSSAAAQDNVIKVNILSPIVKTGSFFFEHKLNDQSSAQLGFLFTNWNIGDTDITGFAITPEYRFYLSEKRPAMEGFYVGPFLRYQNLTLKNSNNAYYGSNNSSEASLDTFGGGILVGRQWIFKERFSLDLFLGPSYNGGTLKYKDSNSNGSFDVGSFAGFGLRSGITFGLAF